MKTNLRTVLLGIVVLAMSSMIATAQAPKKYLFEYFTGAWCQYCPDGAERMKQIAAANSDVIYIAVHGGGGMDNMKTADGNSLISVASVPGYPSGMLDRFGFNATDQNGNAVKATTFNRGDWGTMLQARRQQAPSAPVAVTASGSYNPGNRELTVRVTGDFAAALSGDIRLNAILIEDSVTGAGPGWDQVNYYHTQQGHPYSGRGNPVTNYPHRNVFRANMGGLWGKPNSLPTNITAGSTHSTDLVFTIPAGWNVDKMYVIPVVQRFNALFTEREILNSDKVKVSTLKPRTTVVNFTNVGFTIGEKGDTKGGNAAVQNITVENTEYTVTVTKSATTPADWTTSLTESGNPVSGTILIPANTTKTFTFGLTPGDTPGFGEAVFTVRHPNGQEFSEKVSVLSKNITALNISSNPEQNINQDLIAAGKTHFANIPSLYIASNVADFSTLPSLKTVIWQFGNTDVMAQSDITLMNTYYDKGISIMLGGEYFLFSLAGITTNPATIANPLLAKFGVGFNSPSTVNQATGTVYTLNGVNNDPITNGMVLPFTVSNYRTASLNAAGANASAILRLQGPNEIVAVKNEVNGRGRTIMLGFNPVSISNPQMKAEFIDAAVTWLEGASAGPAPKITASTPQLAFGNVAVDGNKDLNLTITNTGEGDLVLTGNIFVSGDSPNFEVKTGDILNNITLKKDETHQFVLKFTPDEARQYTTKFQIFSNDPNNSILEIPVTGVGGGGPSVIANVQSVEFKGVQIATTSVQTITLTNTGNADLSISAINLSGTDAAAYSIIEGNPGSNPVVVAPNATTTFKIQFAPTQVKPYNNANVVVVSNAGTNFTLAISGEGTPPTSVRSVSSDGTFEMKLVGQNPIATLSAIEFILGSSFKGEAIVSLVDASGATVLPIGTITGSTTLPFSVASLASGAYTVVANVNGVLYTIPVRVAR